MKYAVFKYLCIGLLCSLVVACGGEDSAVAAQNSQSPSPLSDKDGDGVVDTEDAFPRDASESLDSDGDGKGDNSDAFPFDASETKDSDRDGVGDNADLFPFDASETIDTDGDGIGDHRDTDDDNDDVLDVDDDLPKDPTESVDTDHDGIGNNADTDDDNDGVLDVDDAFPEDEDETVDFDVDGVGDNSDTDDDNDGVPDVEDLYPFDASEWADTDGDGVPDNADAFPRNASETLDSDGDGVGDNSDVSKFDPAVTINDDGDGVAAEDDVDDDNDGLIEISTVEQLDWVRNDLTGATLNNGTSSSDQGCPVVGGCIGYELVKNLDFTSSAGYVPDATNGWMPIGSVDQPFTAIFDGNDYEIRNLEISRGDSDNIGLFGYIANAEVHNLVLSGASAYVVGGRYVGAVVGSAHDSTISNMYIMIPVYGDESVGGVVGLAETTVLDFLSTVGDVSGDSMLVGGVAGAVYGSTISRSSATGDVSGHYNVGALLGGIEDSTVSSSYARGEVSALNNAGSLIGESYLSSLSTSFATGAVVTGPDADYSPLDVVVEYFGGLTGYLFDSNISASYWATDATGLGVDTGIAFGDNSIDTFGVNDSVLRCPTEADAGGCIAGANLYVGWADIDHDFDMGASTLAIAPWNFGNSSVLPTLLLKTNP